MEYFSTWGTIANAKVQVRDDTRAIHLDVVNEMGMIQPEFWKGLEHKKNYWVNDLAVNLHE